MRGRSIRKEKQKPERRERGVVYDVAYIVTGDMVMHSNNRTSSEAKNHPEERNIETEKSKEGVEMLLTLERRIRCRQRECSRSLQGRIVG